MRWLLLIGWLLLGATLVLWHRGPGQDWVRLDEAAALLAKGDRCAAEGLWGEAVAAYDAALGLLPAARVDTARRVRLAKAQALMRNKQLDRAREGLEALCVEMQADPAADRALLARARSALAQAHYYTTWVMRLRGEPREHWEPEVEAARQTYRLLAEQAGERGDETAQRGHQEDLETAVRLARMDIDELQGRPLPGGVGGVGKKSPSPAKSTTTQRPPADSRGASSGPPPDTGGH
jgi:tetratricopeptide (TPR) repeat protein